MFRRENLKMSERIYNNYEDLQQNPPIAEALITGSDQVWNYEVSEADRNAFFLQFGDEVVKRISYAPSIGHPTYEQTLYPILTQNLAKFNAISVREQAAVEILKKAGYSATQVLDPTLLLDYKDYASLFEDEVKRRRPFVFIYSMNYVSINDLPFEEIKKYSKENCYDIIVTPGTGLHRCKKLFNRVSYNYATPSEWLLNIANSEFVITASFHGIVFCIIFHKKFIYTPLMGWWEGRLVQKRGNGRVLDLLQRLGLEYLVYDKTESIDKYLRQDVDWSSVDQKLEEMRSVSKNFLDMALC